MPKEMEKAYEPSKYEGEIYKKWEESGYFNPDKLDLPETAENYSIIMPPPNVTGVLHMGSAMMLALQDILIRYNRMQGKRTVWVPGTDHAAIATQNRVEKNLRKEGITRHDLGREQFLEKVNDFAEESKKTIISQTKKMGSSCDWSREAFTLDAVRNKIVNNVFKLMYDDGIIYRGERVVNWCPRCHSTLADDEVEHKNQKGILYTFKYDKDFPITIASTRPETKLGDTAVAVNPKDDRYKKYIGKEYEADFCGIKLKLKVIADRGIDMEYGTGALGVTPAHSMVDWQMAEENDLRVIKAIDENGNIKEGFGEYSGKTTVEAREMLVEKMRGRGLIEKEEELENNLSICYRCDTTIEPLPSLQWFINVNKKFGEQNKTIKELCLEAVESGVFEREGINIIPERFKKNYFNWMNDLRDWCISRQIWYGHRVPVWYHEISDFRLSIVELNFRNREMFDLIKAGKKTIETRALNPDEKDRYFGDINEGQELALNYIENDKVVETINAKVKVVYEYKNTDEMLEELDIEKIYPGGDKQALIDFQKSIPGYVEKIEKNGIIAFELEEIKQSKSDNRHSKIFVGTEAPEGEGWRQDEDTLDTWFSSGMWTFSTMAHSLDEVEVVDGKLKINSDDFKNFHPTAVLETMYDILFFWVARMIIMTTYAMDDIPFQDVYLHGCVRDKFGDKMSKSKPDTCIDPLDVCTKYGTDAVRLSLIMGISPGNDIKIYEDKIVEQKNFVNKLWNIARYIINETKEVEDRKINEEKLTNIDKWILDELKELTIVVNNNIKKYDFSLAGERLREFTWDKLADWYLEMCKFSSSSEKEKVLLYILEELLKLWHPFIPFVTEVIWKEINADAKMLIVEKYPDVKKDSEANDKIKEDVNLLIKIISDIRTARAENKVEPAKKVKAVVFAGKYSELLKAQEVLIKSLRTGIEEIEFITEDKEQTDAINIAVGEIKIYLLGAIDKEKEQARIKKEIDNLEKLIAIGEKKLANKQFVDNAPKEVVERERANLEARKQELLSLK